MTVVLIAIACGLVAVLYGIITSVQVLRAPAGNERMHAVAAAIQEGAKAYLGRQYTTIAIVGVVVAALVGYFLGITEAIGFVDRRDPVRRRRLYRHEHLGPRQRPHRRSGAHQPAGRPHRRLPLGRDHRHAGRRPRSARHLGLLLRPRRGPGPRAQRPRGDRRARRLAFGASLISIFARLGGGIFTKAADVGADLVGKVEAGIPEDDPRNPAVIADNVGDNVGDCAGMAADLFETYVVTVGATMVLIALLVSAGAEQMLALMSLPLIIGGVCILTSIIGTYAVRLGRKQSIMGALYKGFWLTALLSIPAIYYVMMQTLGDINAVIGGATEAAGLDVEPQVAATAVSDGFTGMDLFWCSLVGLGRHRPDRLDHRILYRHQLPPGPVDRPGLADRPRHQRHPGPRDQPRIDGAADARDLRRHHRLLPARRPDRHRLRGDRDAGAGRHGRRARRLRPGHRQCRRHRRNGGPATTTCASRTDALDAVGNTTKAVTKGYAIGSAGLAALVLFGAYTTDLERFSGELGIGIDGVDFSLSNPYVVVGLLLGALLPYLFSAMGMTAVGRAAGTWWRTCATSSATIPGIMDGTVAAQLRPHRRSRHQGGDQGDDHPLAAAGAGADRRLLRHPG